MLIQYGSDSLLFSSRFPLVLISFFFDVHPTFLFFSMLFKDAAKLFDEMLAKGKVEPTAVMYNTFMTG